MFIQVRRVGAVGAKREHFGKVNKNFRHWLFEQFLIIKS